MRPVLLNRAFFIPKKHSLDQILEKYPFVFLALHGGVGEDGTLQRVLEKKKIKFNGNKLHKFYKQGES